MKRLRLLVLVLVLLVVAALLALAGPLRGRWEEILRALVEREVAFALQTDCSVESLGVALPAAGGRRGFVSCRARSRISPPRASSCPQTSLRQARLVLDVEADGLTLDLRPSLRAAAAAGRAARLYLPVSVAPHRGPRRAVRLSKEPEPLIASAPLVAGHLTADGLMGNCASRAARRR
jgi:hypothetical protein